MPVAGDLLFKDISAGAYHTCGIQNATGLAFCWGERLAALLLLAAGAPGRLFAAGAVDCCTGTKLWLSGRRAGSNTFGALGDTTTDNRNTPTRVASDASFQQISAGDFHTCGVQNATGLAFCWGEWLLALLLLAAGAPGRRDGLYADSPVCARG